MVGNIYSKMTANGITFKDITCVSMAGGKMVQWVM